MADEKNPRRALLYPCDEFLFFDSFLSLEEEIEPWMAEEYPVAYTADAEVVDLIPGPQRLRVVATGRFDRVGQRRALMGFLEWIDEPDRLAGRNAEIMTMDELWAVCAPPRTPASR